MKEPKSPVESYRFDDFTLDAINRRIWRKGELVSLNSKYFDVLLLLVRHRGRLIEKQRIFDEVWNGIFVTDAALTQCIKDIMAHSFADSRITMDPLAYFFGEVHFGTTMQIVLGAIEGLLFDAGVGAGIELSAQWVRTSPGSG